MASGILKDGQEKHKGKDAEQETTEPPLPGETRFTTNYPCLRRMSKNKTPLQALLFQQIGPAPSGRTTPATARDQRSSVRSSWCHPSGSC